MGIKFNGCDMGTMQEAEVALAEKARVYRDHRQPVVASPERIKALEAEEREARFQCANAAIHWLWHHERARASAES